MRSLLVVSGAIFLVWHFWLSDGVCIGNCAVVAVVRSHAPETREFKVSGPYKMDGVVETETHTFATDALTTIEGRGFGYRHATSNHYGEDALLDYLTPDRLAQYHAEFVQVGKECPSWWMHQNLKIYVLVGATEDISKELRRHRFEIEHGGSRFAYEGHAMTYASSVRGGKTRQLKPASHESAYSNVGHANTPYAYFLVTRIGRSPGGKQT